MTKDKRKELQDELRQLVTTVALNGEIAPTKRTERQQSELEEAQNALHAGFDDYWQAVSEHRFQNLLILEEPFMRWETIVNDSRLTAAPVPNTTWTQEQFTSVSTHNAQGHRTVIGAYEEASSLLREYKRVLDDLRDTFRIMCGFDKPTKADALFSQYVPEEITLRYQQIEGYDERFKRRIEGFVYGKEQVAQLLAANKSELPGASPNPPYGRPQLQEAGEVPTQAPTENRLARRR